MPDDISPANSPPVSRPKASRSNTISSTTAGAVRSRTSPPPGEQNGDGRPPTKRARKAINCEPCRNSKLKCDRNRPCSSCVLRGTSALCYQDSRGHEGAESLVRGDDHHHSRIDPAQEIARLRHSVSLLESYIFPNQRNPTAQPIRRTSDASALLPKREAIDHDVAEKSGPTPGMPGMLGTHGQGGPYAGATSAATHLLMTDGPDEHLESRQDSQDRTSEDLSSVTPEYDRDLLAMLPSLDIIDGLIKYYFEYCNWIYRHVNQPAFSRNWERFKNGSSADRLVLSTICLIMSVAVHYMPERHQLLSSLTGTHEEISRKFYEVSRTALQRYREEYKKYSLELVELLLIKTHSLTLSKTDTEEVWRITGELVNTGTAMGLHRDPGKWKMHRDVAERRRWAWWHIMMLERWQAFMFGRPIAIAAHHFDTQLPSYCDPALDKSGRLYLPNIALFRLSSVIADIMDDAVSVRPTSYDSVMANDRALTRWMEELPEELDLDEFRVARNLASPNVSLLRQGVQSVIIRTTYYHVRFTLHRPYSYPSTGPSPTNGSNGKPIEPPITAQSLEIAVAAADKLITMVGQSRPDFLANTALAVPGHMNWGPFHCFSAAMFFSFQLIANPDQPGAGLFRSSIRKALVTLEQARGSSVADKGYEILSTLSPLYSVEFPQEPPEVREKLQSQVLSSVRKLAFPYHDSHDPRRFVDSPNGRNSTSSPEDSHSLSPPLGMMLPQYDVLQGHSLSSMRTTPNHQLPSIYTTPTMSTPGHALSTDSPHSQTHSSPGVMSTPTYLSAPSTYPGNPYSVPPQPQNYNDTARYAPYVHPADEAIWGASVGFGQGEWAQFLNGLQPQRPEPSPPIRHHGP